MKKVIQKTFSYCLDPTVDELILCAQSAGCGRYIFNFGLNKVKSALNAKSKIPTYTDLANLLPDLKRANKTNWLKNVHSQILQQALKDLESAVKNLFRDGTWGFPQFKRKGKKDSFRYPQNIKVADGRVYLPKIGWVKYHNSRDIEGTIKQATVKRKGKRWFVHIVCDVEVEIQKRELDPKKIVGIDLGINQLAYLSNGKAFENPKFLKADLKKLQHLQRGLSRKQKKSKNRKKAAHKVAGQHIKIANKRKDYLHKISTAIIENQDGIIVEDLNVSGMLKNRRLSRSIADVSWKEFVTFLKYKAAWQDKSYVVIDRYEPTSKLCSSCGYKKEMPLEVRVFICDVCGFKLDRDWNAAKNIRAAGLAVLACGGLNGSSPSEARITGF